MEILDDLLANLTIDAPIRKINTAVHWTAVSSVGCGMASTLTADKPHGEDRVVDAGHLLSKTARELAKYSLSQNPLEASIGLAALNSLISLPEDGLAEINAFRYLIKVAEGKVIAVFGHFPYLDDLRTAADKLIVFEISPTEGELSLDQVPTRLPEADMVAITSNSLINHTLGNILPYTKKGSFIAMVGPSTPLSPVLFDHGISMLSGVRVFDEDALYRSITQGAIFRQVQGVELVTWIRSGQIL